ncbi:MAG: GcrA cell cycle regulator [Devosia sp.]|uniref:GcrA family cell cycle regulator n=1 Tax=Devosia sp. TaxID=1871048 RepID=UPI0026389428|nr:GcrA family cell cycle regulator [Devosia sp.]MDB5542701.1 GcrA cell cycle regulator [Devosia sp.]
MGWTEERVELLKKLWLEGLSASQIAGVLGEGVTRNAVIGKVHRLKLSGRAKPATSTPRVRSAPRPAARRVSSPSNTSRSSGLGTVMKTRNSMSAGGAIQGATALKISEEFEVNVEYAPQVAELFIPVEQRLSLLELSEQTCKWPIGDPLTPDFYFCGQHSNEGKPYCEFHSRRAYHQIDKKKR